MAKAKHGIPEGMHTLTTQLSLDNAAEAIEFYKRAFGAEEKSRAPDPSGQKIWHADLRIGNSSFFVNDTFEGMGGPQTAAMWIYHASNVDEAWQRATAAGCKVVMPIADMFWGDRIGTLEDKWGVRWTLAQHMEDLSPAEMKAKQDAFVASMKK